MSVIISHGYNTRSFAVPPFILDKNEVITLEVPWFYGSKRDQLLRRIFTGRMQAAEIEILEPVSYLGYERTQNLYEDTLVKDVITDRVTPRESAILNSILQRTARSIDHPCWAMGQSQRVLIEFCIIRSRASGIVFTSSGLDPCGIEDVHKWVDEFVRPHCGVIHLVHHGRDRRFDHFSPAYPKVRVTVKPDTSKISPFRRWLLKRQWGELYDANWWRHK